MKFCFSAVFLCMCESGVRKREGKGKLIQSKQGHIVLIQILELKRWLMLSDG